MLFCEQYNIILKFMQEIDTSLGEELNQLIKDLPNYITSKCKHGQDFEHDIDLKHYYLTNIDEAADCTEIEFCVNDYVADKHYLLNLKAISNEFLDNIPMQKKEDTKLDLFEAAEEIGSFNIIYNQGLDMVDYVLELVKKHDGYHAELKCTNKSDNNSEVRVVDKLIDDPQQLVAYVNPSLLN